MDRMTMCIYNRTAIAYAQLTPLITSDGTVTGTWNRYYRGRRKANDVINNAGQAEIGNMQLIERYVAEAKFLRAYYYTQLTSLWGDVPLITETLDINDHRGRTEKETVVNFIIEIGRAHV